jgi:hypothetical protein
MLKMIQVVLLLLTISFQLSISAPTNCFNAVTADALGMVFSSSGPIKGKHCVLMNEPDDSHGWTDNYLCFYKDFGVKWIHNGRDWREFKAPGGSYRDLLFYQCTQALEISDPDSWSDNYLCVLPNNTWWFVWSFKNPVRGLSCITINEPEEHEMHYWDDNYLCVVGTFDRRQVRPLTGGWPVSGSAMWKCQWTMVIYCVMILVSLVKGMIR